jgi:hypothetical protein
VRTKPAQARKVGRPATITLEVVRAIGVLIAKGIPEEYACTLVGVNYKTFEGARAKSDEFQGVIREERAKFLDFATETLLKSEKGHRGIEFLLERRHRDFFTKAAETQVNVDARKVTNNFTLSDEDFQILQEAAQRRYVTNAVPIKIAEPQTT